jgi:hypothetical protein
LNEHLSPRLAIQLRRYGFDAVSSQEAGMLSESDKGQFGWAVSQERAIVTFNFSDFMVIHEEYLASGRQHFGVIFSTAESVPVLLRRLLRLLNSLSADDLRNQVRWLNEFR